MFLCLYIYSSCHEFNLSVSENKQKKDSDLRQKFLDFLLVEIFPSSWMDIHTSHHLSAYIPLDESFLEIRRYFKLGVLGRKAVSSWAPGGF